MMNRAFIITVFLLFGLVSFSQNVWYVNFTPGVSVTPPVPLSVRQENMERINIWAKYRTDPLRLPIYYSYRLGFMKQGKGWELEMNHLKLILKNNPNEIQNFSISHGYNMLFVNRVFTGKMFSSKVGLGLAITHPENTVRYKELDEKQGIMNWGYYISGPSVQYCIFKKFTI